MTFESPLIQGAGGRIPPPPPSHCSQSLFTVYWTRLNTKNSQNHMSGDREVYISQSFRVKCSNTYLAHLSHFFLQSKKCHIFKICLVSCPVFLEQNRHMVCSLSFNIDFFLLDLIEVLPLVVAVGKQYLVSKFKSMGESLSLKVLAIPLIFINNMQIGIQCEVSNKIH